MPKAKSLVQTVRRAGAMWCDMHPPARVVSCKGEWGSCGEMSVRLLLSKPTWKENMVIGICIDRPDGWVHTKKVAFDLISSEVSALLAKEEAAHS